MARRKKTKLERLYYTHKVARDIADLLYYYPGIPEKELTHRDIDTLNRRLGQVRALLNLEPPPEEE